MPPVPTPAAMKADDPQERMKCMSSGEHKLRITSIGINKIQWYQTPNAQYGSFYASSAYPAVCIIHNSKPAELLSTLINHPLIIKGVFF